MYVTAVPNRNSPPAILLRESYRHNGKVKSRTLANLSKWPQARIEALRRVLKDEPLAAPEQALDIVRSLPHGHVAAALGTVRKLELDRLISTQPSPERDRVLALVVARVLAPGSKLATARGLARETARDSLASTLGLDDSNEDDLYAAMDWLLERQGAIEKRLAKRHLEEGSLVLYDVTSSYVEGRRCPLARHGYSRDGKRGKLQIVFGLLCNREGCPVAVEVFEGHTADPATLSIQIDKLRRRFALARVVLVGDRGLLTTARIREEVQPAGLDWISALRAPAIRRLAEDGALQPSLFDQRHLAEITSPDYPAERLIVCRNPLLAQERARKREALLQATERELDRIVAATTREKRRLSDPGRIQQRLGKVLSKHKVGKHFETTVSEDGVLTHQRRAAAIAQEAALDGFYVIRTNLPQAVLNAQETVGAYKSLSVVERAFRSYKTVDLKVRPIFHYAAHRVRAHVFLCMLAYYVEWHMRQRLKPLLFDDHDPQAAEALRPSVVAPAQVSPAAKDKADRKITASGLPVHSFRSLLKDLATIAINRVVTPQLPDPQPFDIITRPTPLQAQILKLLGVRLERTQ